MNWRKSLGVFILLVGWTLGAQAAPAHPYLLVVVGHMGRPETNRQANFVLLNWVHRIRSAKFRPGELKVRKINVDLPAQKVVATRLGLVSPTGILLGLATSDAKELPDKLVDKAGPFDWRRDQYLRNPDFGRLLDAMWGLVGKAGQETGHIQPCIGLFVLDPAKMTVEEQSMYQVVQKGAVVFHVTPDSEAQKAGVREGDEVVAVDSHPVASTRECLQASSAKSVGDPINLTCRRAGKTRNFTFKVGPWP